MFHKIIVIMVDHGWGAKSKKSYLVRVFRMLIILINCFLEYQNTWNPLLRILVIKPESRSIIRSLLFVVFIVPFAKIDCDNRLWRTRILSQRMKYISEGIQYSTVFHSAMRLLWRAKETVLVQNLLVKSMYVISWSNKMISLSKKTSLRVQIAEKVSFSISFFLHSRHSKVASFVRVVFC